jgi:hypothetical protein
MITVLAGAMQATKRNWLAHRELVVALDCFDHETATLQRCFSVGAHHARTLVKTNIATW